MLAHLQDALTAVDGRGRGWLGGSAAHEGIEWAELLGQLPVLGQLPACQPGQQHSSEPDAPEARPVAAPALTDPPFYDFTTGVLPSVSRAPPEGDDDAVEVGIAA